jgi:ABC-type transporter Mla subunit MlaD
VEQNGRALDRVKKALESTEKELGAIRGSLASGGRDLRKDATKLLKDARREVEKMNKSVARDLERLQKDLTAAAKAKPASKAKPKRAARKATRTTKRTAARKRRA